MGMYIDIPFDGTCKTCIFSKLFDNSKVYCEKYPAMIIEDPTVEQSFCNVRAVDLFNLDHDKLKLANFIVDNGEVEFTHKVTVKSTGEEVNAFIYDHSRAMVNCSFEDTNRQTRWGRELVIGNTYLISILEWVMKYRDIQTDIQLSRTNQWYQRGDLSSKQIISNSSGLFLHLYVYDENGNVIRDDMPNGFTDNDVCFVKRYKNEWDIISADITLPYLHDRYYITKIGEE
jgi:hypothetical protein